MSALQKLSDFILKAENITPEQYVEIYKIFGEYGTERFNAARNLHIEPLHTPREAQISSEHINIGAAPYEVVVIAGTAKQLAQPRSLSEIIGTDCYIKCESVGERGKIVRKLLALEMYDACQPYNDEFDLCIRLYSGGNGFVMIDSPTAPIKTYPASMFLGDNDNTLSVVGKSHC